MLTNKEIGNNLVIFAKENFKNLTGLANEIGLSLNAFQPYYKGKSILGGKLLAKLADLGCDINWLLTGSYSENNSEDQFQITNEKFNQLKKDVDDLKELLILALKENKDLKENNKKLKKDNEKWRRLFDQGGSLDGFESKMNE